MLFTSQIFLFYFLPLVLLACYGLPGKRNLVLLLASYVFYGWCGPWAALWLLVATVVNYGCGLLIVRSPLGSWRRSLALAASVTASLSMLGVFKYATFFQENLNHLRTSLGTEAWPVLAVALPAGISFYIFQNLSYTVDLYRGDCQPARSLAEYACFVALFPKLLTGPITRFQTVAPQFAVRGYSLDRFAAGTALFILGFAKKTLLANPIGGLADAVFAAESPAALDVWVGATAYAFQIYFDFAGYSDMAVGLGRMLGFELPRNFNAPYLADSITDFWRRWHISLSTFLRDYLYIPLGGNRKGPLRTYLNLALVMLLGGLWHGAAWTFIAWGGCHGLLLICERWLGRRTVYAGLPRAMQIACTFVLLLFTWVFFRAPNLAEACRLIGTMLGLAGTPSGTPVLAAVLYTQGHLVLLGICAVLVFQPWQAMDWVEELTWPRAAVLIPLFCLAVGETFVQAFTPFLYFQF